MNFKQLVLVSLCCLSGWSMDVSAQQKGRGPKFNPQRWKQQYGSRIDLSQWRDKHPIPWGGWFAPEKPECGKTWYVQIGPVGVNTLMHDQAQKSIPTFHGAAPAIIKNGSGDLHFNTVEIVAVDPTGPAKGILEPGDLIVTIDGEFIKSPGDVYKNREIMEIKRRNLEVHVGVLIDRAQARGRVTFGVIRVPKSDHGRGGRSRDELLKLVKPVTVAIDPVGSFGDQFDPKSSKLANISFIMAERLIAQQEEAGFWQAPGTYAGNGFHTAMCGLGLLATGDPRYNEAIKKAAYWIAYESWGTDWAYPTGIEALFVGEYVLRSKDRGILKGYQSLLDRCRPFVLSDYVAGHKYHPGYAGSGYIGGGAAIASAFAVASHTPLNTYNDLLDQMLRRAQELAPQGTYPYGRYSGKKALFNGQPSRGQSYSAGTGPMVLATFIRGGSRYFAEVTAKKYGQGPWGDADGGHATHILTYVWGALASSIVSNEGLKGSMEAFFWRLTLTVGYDGFVNMNGNRLEYHGGEGIMGYPYWNTGAYLMVFNAHKRNMAITGHPKYKARRFRNYPLAYMPDKSFQKAVQRNWNMVVANLGKKSPKPLLQGLAMLRTIPEDEKLGERVFDLLNTQGVEAAKVVASYSGLPANQKADFIEAILGIGVEINIFKPEKKEGSSASDLTPKIEISCYSPNQRWNECGPKGVRLPAPAIDLSGRIDLSNKESHGLAANLHFEFNKDKMKYTSDISVSGGENVPLNAKIQIKVAGLEFSYDRTVWAFPTHPQRDFANRRRIWVPGVLNESSMYYKFPIQLATGDLLDAKCTEGRHILVHDRGKVLGEKESLFINAGLPCKFLLSEGDKWEARVQEVEILKPELARMVPSSVTAEGGSIDGEVSKLYDLDFSTVVTASINSGRDFMYLYFEFPKPVACESFAMYLGRGHGNYEVAYHNGRDYVAQWYGGFRGRRLLIHKPVKSNKFRVKLMSNPGAQFAFKEFHFHPYVR